MASLDDIVKQVVNRLRAEGKQVTKAIAHVVSETLFNPETGRFYVEDDINEHISKVMIEKAVDTIKDPEDLLNRTLLLQTSRFFSYSRV